MGDEQIRAAAANMPVPELGPVPFVRAAASGTERVALVTTAALFAQGEQPVHGGDASFRILTGIEQLALGHQSPNFDRSGWLADPNVIFPLGRLHDLAEAGAIGSVAPRHLAFAGNQQNETLATIGLDSGPAAARLLREDGVDVAILTPV